LQQAADTVKGRKRGILDPELCLELGNLSLEFQQLAGLVAALPSDSCACDVAVAVSARTGTLATSASVSSILTTHGRNLLPLIELKGRCAAAGGEALLLVYKQEACSCSITWVPGSYVLHMRRQGVMYLETDFWSVMSSPRAEKL